MVGRKKIRIGIEEETKKTVIWIQGAPKNELPSLVIARPSRSACEPLFAGESQTDNERRSAVQFRADGNRSFARFDDSFDDGKAKSGSGDRPDFLSPEKRFEYVCEVVREIPVPLSEMRNS